MLLINSPYVSAETLDDAGRQLDQLRRDMERQRIKEQIDEDRKSEDNSVEVEEDKNSKTDDSDFKFILTKVTADESEIITEDVLNEIAAPYLNIEVGVNDLYEIVKKINDYYQKEGYLTCRAFLKNQTINQGVIHISLIEGKTGEVNLTGNKNTAKKYFTRRVKINSGEVQNISTLNKQLNEFNLTNDVKLRINLKAGKEPGTTDYELKAIEPKNHIFTLYADSDGSKSTGTGRVGIYYNNRSLFKHRDSLLLGYMHSKGSDSFSASYSIPAGVRGERLRFSYGTSGTKNVANRALDLRGHSYYADLTYSKPLKLTLKERSEIGLSLGINHSVNDIANEISIVDNRTTTAALYFSRTNYLPRSVFYRRYSYTFGKWKDKVEDNNQNFGIFRFNSFYQHAWKHGQTLDIDLNAQWSSTKDLASSDQFSIGGRGSVRGYKNNLIEGADGATISLEYGVPLGKNFKAFCFADAGIVDNTFLELRDKKLASVGVGVQARIEDKLLASVAVGFPLKHEINDEEQSRARLHVSLIGKF
jgi:hemolysin activation/secretion protein